VKGAQRLWLWIPWALFALAVLAWTGYWHFTAAEAKRALVAWAAAQEEAGATAKFGALRAHGYPVLLRIEVPDVRYAPAAGGWRLETARFDAHVNLVNPAQFGAVAKAPIEIRRDNEARATLTADVLIATLRMRGRELTRVSLQGAKLSLDDPAKPGALTVAALLLNARPDEREAGAWQMAVEATDLHLARPVRGFEGFGQQIAEMRALAVLGSGGVLFGGKPGVSLDDWRDSGGRLHFEALELAWGPLSATGAGEVSLDLARRLQGALALSVTRPADTLAALAQGAHVAPEAKTALNAMGSGLALLGQQAPVTVAAHDGALSVGREPLRTLAPLY
jgi:hypothetical protein